MSRNWCRPSVYSFSQGLAVHPPSAGQPVSQSAWLATCKRGTRHEVSLNASPRRRPSRGISWLEQEAERRLLGGNNGQGHLSCVAALPFAHNGSRGWREGVGGLASGGFLLRSLLSGDTSVPHNGPFVPSLLFFFFLPTFNPSSLLLFLPLVSVPPQTPLRENKNKKKTQLKLQLFIPLPSTPVSPPPSGPQDPIWRPGRFSRVAHLAPKNSPPF